MTTKAYIKRGGLFSDGQIVVHKENSRAQDKVIVGANIKVKDNPAGGYIVEYTSTGSSIGFSKSGISSRRYARRCSVAVDEYEFTED